MSATRCCLATSNVPSDYWSMGSARATRNTEGRGPTLRRPGFRVWTLRRNTGSQILRGCAPESERWQSTCHDHKQSLSQFPRNKGLRSSHISEKTMPLLSAPLSRSVGGRNTEATSGAALSAPPRQCPPHPPRFNGFGASGLPSTPGSRFRLLPSFFFPSRVATLLPPILSGSGWSLCLLFILQTTLRVILMARRVSFVGEGFFRGSLKSEVI